MIKRPKDWAEFGKIFDAAIQAGHTITIHTLNPNSDDCVSWVDFSGVLGDDKAKANGAKANGFDLFKVMAKVANKVKLEVK